MESDEIVWYKIAERTSRSVAEVKSETSATEFRDWKFIIDNEPNEFNVLHWYLAQIAFEVHRVPYHVWGKTTDSSITVESFLMKFGPKKKPVEETRPDIGSEEWKEHVKTEKSKILKMFGIDPVVLEKNPQGEETSPVYPPQPKLKTKLPPKPGGTIPSPIKVTPEILAQQQEVQRKKFGLPPKPAVPETPKTRISRREE